MPDGNYRQTTITRQELENSGMGAPRRNMVVGRPPGLDAIVQRHNRQQISENLERGNIENSENDRNSQNDENSRPESGDSNYEQNREFRAFSQQRYNPDDYQAPPRRENVADRSERPNIVSLRKNP